MESIKKFERSNIHLNQFLVNSEVLESQAYKAYRKLTTAGGVVNNRAYASDRTKTDELGNLIWVKFHMIE